MHGHNSLFEDEIQLPTDFDAAFSLFTSEFPSINSTGGDTAKNAVLSPQSQFLAPLLNEQESSAFSQFLENVVDDPNFIFDPKLADGLPQWSDLEVDLVPSEASSSRSEAAFITPHNERSIELAQIPDQDKSPLPTLHEVVPPDSEHRTPSASEGSSPGTRKASKKRENLSEDQRRRNHMSSEKRRRDLIKKNFDDLCQLVPKLSQGPPGRKRNSAGTSKSDILSSVYDYMIVVIEQNKALRSVLAANGISTADIPDSLLVNAAGQSKG
jgi:hypothetical protein